MSDILKCSSKPASCNTQASDILRCTWDGGAGFRLCSILHSDCKSHKIGIKFMLFYFGRNLNCWVSNVKNSQCAYKHRCQKNGKYNICWGVGKKSEEKNITNVGIIFLPFEIRPNDHVLNILCSCFK